MTGTFLKIRKKRGDSPKYPLYGPIFKKANTLKLTELKLFKADAASRYCNHERPGRRAARTAVTYATIALS